MVPAPADKTRLLSGYPAGSWLNYVAWSRDSRHISFTVRSPGGPEDPARRPLELWLADAASGVAKLLLQRPLNTIFEE